MNTEQLKRDPMKETEQTLLDQIKDEVAEQYGQISWKYAMQNNGSHGISALWEYVCERYAEAKAKASCEATLKKAESAYKTVSSNTQSCGKFEIKSHYDFEPVESSEPQEKSVSAPSESQEEIVKHIASIAWKGAANAYRMYPDNKHTFASYWDAAKDQFKEFFTRKPE